jgi:hypothetical protein
LAQTHITDISTHVGTDYHLTKISAHVGTDHHSHYWHISTCWHRPWLMLLTQSSNWDVLKEG